jgi:hypothetical protein
MNETHTLVFNSVTQYQVTLDFGATSALMSITPPTIWNDSYWYDSGSAVTYWGEATSRGQVVSWNWDNESATAVQGGDFETSPILMNQPHILHVALAFTIGSANGPLETISLSSDSPFPVLFHVGSATFPSPVSLSVPMGTNLTIVATGGGQSAMTRSSFQDWGGSTQADTAQLVFTVSGAANLVAEYRTEYLVSFSFTDAQGNHLGGVTAQATGNEGTIAIGSNETAWLESRTTYAVSDVLWNGASVFPIGGSVQVQISSPSTLALKLSVFHQSVLVTDPLGIPVGGAHVTLAFPGGGTISSVTNSTGRAALEVPSGLFSATASFLGISYSASQGVASQADFVIVAFLDYPVIAIIGIAAVSLSLVVLMMRRRDRHFHAAVLTVRPGSPLLGGKASSLPPFFDEQS